MCCTSSKKRTNKTWQIEISSLYKYYCFKMPLRDTDREWPISFRRVHEVHIRGITLQECLTGNVSNWFESN